MIYMRLSVCFRQAILTFCSRCSWSILSYLNFVVGKMIAGLAFRWKPLAVGPMPMLGTVRPQHPKNIPSKP